MPTVLLVRHATTPTTGKVLYGRSPGVSLSAEGWRQARGTAAWLAGEGRKVHAVYASPLERAQATAQPIAEAMRRDVQTVDGLLEVDFGSWTNRSLAQLRRRKDWAQVQRTPSRWRFPDGESFAEAQRRLATTVEQLAANHTDKQTIVCVSHADCIALLAAYLLGSPIDSFQRIRIAPASVTEVVLARGKAPYVVRVNHTTKPHEPDPQPPGPQDGGGDS